MTSVVEKMHHQKYRICKYLLKRPIRMKIGYSRPFFLEKNNIKTFANKVVNFNRSLKEQYEDAGNI